MYEVLQTRRFVMACSNIMVVKIISFGARGMLDVYMKEEIGSSDSNVSLAFMIFGIIYTVMSIPFGLVSSIWRKQQ